MTDTSKKPQRLITARRVVAVGTLTATALGGAVQAGPRIMPEFKIANQVTLAASHAEGEAEGGEVVGDANVQFLRDIGFMTGHLRAGLQLYQEGDLTAAKTHMGHPIREKYDAVAERLEALGHEGLRDQIIALSDAAEAEADSAEVTKQFDAVISTVEAARADLGADAQTEMKALAALARIAAEEYEVAIEDDGSIGNLHEYQDSWGFLRTVATEAGQLANSDEAAIADAANEIIEQVAATGPAFGDIQGGGIDAADPSILFVAAARMEIAALSAK